MLEGSVRTVALLSGLFQQCTEIDSVFAFHYKPEEDEEQNISPQQLTNCADGLPDGYKRPLEPDVVSACERVHST